MILLPKAKDINIGVDALKAQLAAKDAEIASLKAELAEVPEVAAILDEIKAKL